MVLSKGPIQRVDRQQIADRQVRSADDTRQQRESPEEEKVKSTHPYSDDINKLQVLIRQRDNEISILML